MLCRDRLDPLAAIAIDRYRLETLAPALDVGVLDIFGGRRVGEVDRLGDGPREEGLDGPHHADMAHVVNGALAIRGCEGAIEDREVLFLEPRGALDAVVLVDVSDDLLDMCVIVAEAREGLGDGLVDHLEHAAADELLVFDEADVGLDARRVTVHHEADGPRWREDRDLRVAEAVRFAEVNDLVPDLLCGLHKLIGNVGAVDGVDGVAMASHDAQHGIAIDRVALKGATIGGDQGADAIRFGVKERGHGARVGSAGVAVVGEASAHEERAEVGVT